MILDFNAHLINSITIEPQSSLVSKLVYDQRSFVLTVTYKSGKRKGKTREYSNISLKSFLRLFEADSIGREVLKLAKHSRQLEEAAYPNQSNLRRVS